MSSEPTLDPLALRQRAIEQDLCDQLAETSPDSWTRVELRIERLQEGLQIQISSPEGYDETPSVPPDFQRAVLALAQVYRDRGLVLESATYALHRRGQAWSCTGEFNTSPQS